MTTPKHEIYEMLLMKAIDGQLTYEERELFESHLATCPECAEMLADFQEIKDITDGVRQRILQDARVQPIRESLATKTVTSLSFLAIFGSALLLLGIAGHSFFLDDKVDLLVKIGVGVGGAGLLALFLQVLLQRIRGAAHDPYKDIDL